jgi:Xaa-Pro aminopeptidase
MIKSPLEIAALRKAADITVQGIIVAVKHIAPGVDERTLEAEMEAEFKRQGSPRIPFASIIKSGPNSLWPWRILAAHYERRNRKMKTGELVIFDVGCEYKNYVSDMGRTFPVSGKFTAEQKRILIMETAVSDAIIAAIKPGMTFADLKKVADATIPESEKKYMQVGLFFGHHLGLSSGDPNDPQAKLAPGMVFTVEPWYYNHDKNISVFTEDEVLVTSNGVEVLTKALPRTPEELERLMRK